MGNGTILDFRDVTLTYRGGEVPVEALRGVRFTLGDSEFAAVMGPSGSGKSTLLNLAAGLLTATSGSVVAFDVDLGAVDEDTRTRHLRERVGYLFQFFNLIPSLPVIENVLLPSRIIGADVDTSWIDELCNVTRIEHRVRNMPAELSGGEMQRVSLARALSLRPALLLADEPTGNVSSRDGVAILDLLRSLGDRLGTSVLLVTHNPRDAARADRTVFLSEGRLDEQVVLSGDFGEHDVHAALESLGI